MAMSNSGVQLPNDPNSMHIPTPCSDIVCVHKRAAYCFGFQFSLQAREQQMVAERIHMQSPKVVVAVDYRLNEGVTFYRLFGLRVTNNTTASTKRSAPRDFLRGRKKNPGIRDGDCQVVTTHHKHLNLSVMSRQMPHPHTFFPPWSSSSAITWRLQMTLGPD